VTKRQTLALVVPLILLAWRMSSDVLAQDGAPGAREPDEHGRAVPIVRIDDAHDGSPVLHTIRPNPPRAGQLAICHASGCPTAVTL
jgi:hypothetical protein